MTSTGNTPTIDDPARFGRVAVLMGGTSAEREVSLNSGQAVLAALRAQRVDAHPVDPASPHWVSDLMQGCFDRVFIMLHGRGGEDGVMQGFLQTLGLPYTGSGVLASALSMDKWRTKQLWRSHGVPTPQFRQVQCADDGPEVIAELGLPLAVKPSEEGSSIGITRVENPSQFAHAFEQAHVHHSPVLAEPWILGAEYTCAILGDQVLPLVRLETPRTFYDYQAKYHDNSTIYHCPCGLPDEQERSLGELCRRAFKAVGCSSWGRVDFMLDRAGRPWMLEVNTAPGMTDHSLVPMAAREVGLSFEALVWRILETSVMDTAPVS